MARVAGGELAIEPMTPADWPDVRRIYGEGIATGDATLEIETPNWAAFDRSHRADCRLVGRLAGLLVGWVALSPYSSRRVYRGVAWESVYVAADVRGKGVGRALLDSVIDASEEAGIWTLLAGVLVENGASLTLHEHAGFHRIGNQSRIGQDGSGRWRDVVLLERRSERVGR
jgi:L-amino acid N-acyltransferase YncA